MERADDIAPWVERLRGDLRRLRIPGEARGILVAASGGPDSTALCRLVAAARDLGSPGGALPPLWIGHVHHGTRGEESDLDEAFVRDLARDLRCKFLGVRLDVPAIASSRGLSLESAAREARYGAFSRWARDCGIDAILLAHTADDQAETVLLRILRRAGIRGLAGMPAERPLSSGQAGRFPCVLRPLLAWRRGEVRDFLARIGQPFREDRTNADTGIPRNRIRHRLLPLLRSEFDPAAEDALLEVARRAGNAARDLEALAREALADARKAGGTGFLTLDGGTLARLLPTIRAFAIDRAAAQLAEAGDDPSSPPSRLRRIEEILPWFEGKALGGKNRDLGGGVRAELHQGDLRLSLSRKDGSEGPPPPARLPVPGSVVWGPWEIRAEAIPAGAPAPLGGDAAGLAEVVDGAALGDSLTVRARWPGDRIRPLGAAGSKKLKEFLRERGVPPSMRGEVPIVEGSRGILWVVGHRIAEPCRVLGDGGERVRLTARRIDPAPEERPNR